MPIYEDTDFTLVSRADNTKHARFSLTGIATATERVFALPNLSGSVATYDNPNTFSAYQVFSAGLYIQDVATPTLTFDYQGAPAPFTSFLQSGATLQRTWTLPDDTGKLSAVVAPASATVDKTSQTASIAATTIYTTVHAGRYRISAYAVFSAVTTPGNLTLSAIFTDPVQAQTIAFNRNNTLAYTVVGNEVDGELNFQATTGSIIRFSTTLTGVATYSVYFRLEALT